jgi:hypothetical protein
MTARVLEMAEVLATISQGEEHVRFFQITGVQPELLGLPSVHLMQTALEVSKDIYRQQLRALSQEELRALGTLIN